LLHHNNQERPRELPAVTAKLIVLPRKCDIPSAAIEDLIERLIAVLDERQAACEDLEPDPDYEDGGDAETETWREWRPAKGVLLRPRRISGRCN